MRKIIPVIGLPLASVDYQTAFEAILELKDSNQPSAVAAANTHIAVCYRTQTDFAKVMDHFDLIVPDGMPLIWSMNAKGAHLTDRVYGPYLMRYVIERTPAPYRHFLFGGTPDCLVKLEQELRDLQPNIEIAGTISPPFRSLLEEDEADFSNIINASRPDFVWVALGGEKQEKWIIQNQYRYTRGVFFAIGDAFELLAKQRPFAPRWIQKLGLTWLSRLISDPKRLARRYVKCNTLFIYYTFKDWFSETISSLSGRKSTDK
ncbi:MAG: WecB/TagA/CpsF family glycosyltransferase [Chthoniobacterales bacterium]